MCFLTLAARQHPRSYSSEGAVVELSNALDSYRRGGLCLGLASLSLDELGGPDQLGGDGPSLGAREGSPLLARAHRVPEVEGDAVAVLGDVDPERLDRL